MGKSQRTKGAAAERELAKLLSERLSCDVKRNLNQVRDAGHDLDGLPFALEVKRQEVLRIRDWWTQAVEQGKLCDKPPVLAYRKSRHPWRFVVPCGLLGFGQRGDDYEQTAEIGIDLFVRLVEFNS
jgi:Holliday junction resolvase